MVVPVITHTKVSGKAAGTDATKVYGTHWDAVHTVSGIENVDNTSDASKPVSTLQQAALDLKANLAGAGFTGGVVAPSFVCSTASTPSYTWQITGNGADAKNWDAVASGGGLVFRAVNDLGTLSTNFMEVSRGGGYTISGVAFPVPLSGTTLTINTVNGNTFTAGNYTITGGAAKTLTFSNTLTLAGTDSTTMTFPTTSATIARTDTSQTFTGAQTFSTTIVGSVNGNAATATTASAVAVGNITGAGTGVLTALALNVGSAGAPVTFNGAGGTPSSMTATNLSGTAASLTAGTASAVAVGGITGLGTGVATFLATPSSANLKTAITDETGSGGALVFATSPTITTPGIVGVTDASSAASGNVGQVLTCTTPGTTLSVTVTSATPGIVTWANHGISIGGAVNFTGSPVPTGLTAGTTYYVSSQSYAAGSFAVSTTVANAIAGTSVATSSTGTSVVGCAWAILATTTAKDFAGIALTAGDWYVQASRVSVPANTTEMRSMRVSVSTTTNTADTTPGRFNNVVFGTAPATGYTSNGGQALTLDTTEAEFNVSGTTNVFAVATDTFVTAAQTVYGTIRAVRRSR